jgi:imidazole glycerol-phosphate synthase subunit HisH
MKQKVVIIDYGAGNTRSVCFAFERIGIQPILSSDKEVIKCASHIILPGVGHAKSAMNVLKEKELDDFIPTLTQPVLGICLGMQLMCSFSEEGDTLGLGIFPDKTIRFSDVPKIPHMGWNNLLETKRFLEKCDEQLYFVHSYYVPQSDFSIALCNNGKLFSAALQKDNFIGVQFHPEKSGAIGEQLLKNFLSI